MNLLIQQTSVRLIMKMKMKIVKHYKIKLKRNGHNQLINKTTKNPTSNTN